MTLAPEDVVVATAANNGVTTAACIDLVDILEFSVAKIERLRAPVARDRIKALATVNLFNGVVAIKRLQTDPIVAITTYYLIKSRTARYDVGSIVVASI